MSEVTKMAFQRTGRPEKALSSAEFSSADLMMIPDDD
jgi:hypothetical protein